MQRVSKAYKQAIKKPLRNRGYIKLYIGVVNSEAQRNSTAAENNFTYFSDALKPFNHYQVDMPYATAEEDFSKVDGSMYFLPKEDSTEERYYNGMVTDDLVGSIYIYFGGLEYDIKGLTIDFGECYPVDFTIQSNSNSYTYTDNNKRVWVTEDVFHRVSYVRIVPSKMRFGQDRLRIYQFICGIANSFGNEQLKSFSHKSYVSPITETIPSQDMNFTIDNQNLYYNPDNPDSTLAFMETGQEIKFSFGYDIGEEVVWLPSVTTFLKSWSADDTQAKFTAVDRFDYLNDTYYGGKYYADGKSLYDLAVDVLTDMGITEEKYYYIDPYLKEVKVNNPIPAVKHKEALQIIANAGRCVLYEDRENRINIESSFIPDMTATANNQTGFSNVSSILNGEEKTAYAMASNDFSVVDETVFFLPKGNNYLNTGYVSEVVADSDGNFTENPKITINLEAQYRMVGIQINFRNVAPQEVVIKTYLQDAIVDEVTLANVELNEIYPEIFELFDRMEIEVTKGYPNSRVAIDNIFMGNVTDYVLSRDNDLTSAPIGVRQDKVKTIKVQKTIYSQSTELKDLVSEETVIYPDNPTHTVYFQNPSYDFTVQIDGEEGISAEISDSSSYFAKIDFSGVSEETTVKITVNGYEYVQSESLFTVQHGDIGSEYTWKNPLVSTVNHAKDLEEWLASYYLGDVDYQIQWRGDPRTDANDLFYLELKDRDNALVRCYENSLNFSGAWSGSMKARKVIL